MYQSMELKLKISKSEKTVVNALAFGLIFTTIQALAAPTENCQLVFADSQGAIFRADSVAGTPVIVSKGEKLMQPFGVAVGVSGELYVSDPGCSGLLGIDPASGDQRVICSGGNLGMPLGIAVERSGKILVANGQSLLRVNPDSGEQTVLSSQNLFQVPIAMALGDNEDIYVVDILGAVVRVDPVTGAQTLLGKGGYLHRPQGIAARGKFVYVTDVATGDSNFGIGRIIRIDIRNGHQTILSEGENLVGPVGIGVGPNGQLIVSDPYTINPDSTELFDGGIIRINEKTGAQSLIARGSGSFVNPVGVAIVPAAKAF